MKENIAQENGSNVETHENSKPEPEKPGKRKHKNYRKELKAAQSEVSRLRDQLARTVAEFDNYRRRNDKEFSNLIRNANSELIAQLLPVMDDFERSLNSRTEKTDFDSFFEGVRLIYSKFFKVLQNSGLEYIDAVGKEFDPNLHEALLTMERDGHPANVVIEEHLKGYRMNDKVIRHSQVIVSK